MKKLVSLKDYPTKDDIDPHFKRFIADVRSPSFKPERGTFRRICSGPSLSGDW
jgi:hypothetical protein